MAGAPVFVGPVGPRHDQQRDASHQWRGPIDQPSTALGSVALPTELEAHTRIERELRQPTSYAGLIAYFRKQSRLR